MSQSDARPYGVIECPSRLLFDAQGNFYGTGYPKGSPPKGGSSGYFFVSYGPSGEFRWATPEVGPASNEDVNNEIIGADGNIYIYVDRHIEGFRSSDGTLLWDVEVPNAGGGRGLYADASGLTFAGTIRYDYAGNLVHAAPAAGVAGGSPLAQEPGGGVYTGTVDYSHCGDRVRKYTIKVSRWTLAGIKWTKTIPGPTTPGDYTECTSDARGLSLRAVPGGGVVAGAKAGAFQSNTGNVDSVFALDASGRIRWTRTINRGWTEEFFSGLRVTNSGEIVTVQYGRGVTCSKNVVGLCGTVAVDFLSGATGNPDRPPVFVQNTDQTSNQACCEPTDPAEDGLAVGQEALYLPLRIDGESQVVAVSVPGLESDYEDALRAGGGSDLPSSYVALGDSFSSGEGNPPYEPASDSSADKCHRSEAYGPMLDRDIALGPMSFWACSGAVTDDLFKPNPSNLPEPAQIDWLSSFTKTVTLTIGGDDAGFVSVLEHCVAGPRSDHFQPFGCSKDKLLRAEVTTRLSALAGKVKASTPGGRPIHPLSEIIAKLHAEALNARIVIAGYPALFGPNTITYEADGEAPSGLACTVGALVPSAGPYFKVDFDDALWMNALGTKLDAYIAQAVNAAHQAGIPVSYAAPTQFKAHALCDTGEPWFHPLELEGFLPPNQKSGSFHPTQTGQLLGYEAAFKAKLK